MSSRSNAGIVRCGDKRRRRSEIIEALLRTKGRTGDQRVGDRLVVGAHYVVAVSTRRPKFHFLNNADRKRIASALAVLRQPDGTFHRRADHDEPDPKIVEVMDLEDVMTWLQAIAFSFEIRLGIATTRDRREIDTSESWRKLGKAIVELERRFGALDPVQREEFDEENMPAPAEALLKWREIALREQALVPLRSALVDRPEQMLYRDFAKEWILFGGKPSLSCFVRKDGQNRYSPFIRFLCACAEPLLKRPLSPASMKPVATWAKEYAAFLGIRLA